MASISHRQTARPARSLPFFGSTVACTAAITCPAAQAKTWKRQYLLPKTTQAGQRDIEATEAARSATANVLNDTGLTGLTVPLQE